MASNGNTTVDQEQLKVSLNQWHQFVKASTWATGAIIIGLVLLALITL